MNKIYVMLVFAYIAFCFEKFFYWHSLAYTSCSLLPPFLLLLLLLLVRVNMYVWRLSDDRHKHFCRLDEEEKKNCSVHAEILHPE